jgi:DNA-directed RNA polymerase subunit RPC12/RpoP
VDLAHEAQQPAHVHHQPEKVPVKSGFSGLFFGLIAAPILVIGGGMICLTGLGIFLGVPLIIAGACAPLIGPLVGLNSLKGSCPWCNGEISGVGLFDYFSCPNCNRRIAVKDREMLKAG